MPPQYAPDDPVPTVCRLFCAHLPSRPVSKTSSDSVCMTRCLITPSKWYNYTRYVFIAYLSNLYRCNHAPDSFACLVSVDSDTLNSANDAVALSAFYGTFIFVPVVDGTFIVERPTVTMDRQIVNGVSLMDRILLACDTYFLYRTYFCQSRIHSKAAYLHSPPKWTSPISSDRCSLFLAPSRSTKLPATIRPPMRLFPGRLISLLQSWENVRISHYSSAIHALLKLTPAIFICPTYFLLKAFNGKSWKVSWYVYDPIYWHFWPK